jgi:hypothetical protein
VFKYLHFFSINIFPNYENENSDFHLFEKYHNLQITLGKKLNSVALARKQTIVTERPPLVGEVSANFCG